MKLWPVQSPETGCRNDRAEAVAEDLFGVGVEKLVRLPFPQHNFHAEATEKLFIFVEPRTVVEIAHHNQRIAFGQMLLHPCAQPDALRQLLAAVGDGDLRDFRRRRGPMWSFRFGVNNDEV